MVRCTVVAALIVAAPLSLAACTSSPASSDSTSSASGVGARWGACMRDAGLDVEDPDDESVRTGTYPAPDGGDGQAFTRQAQECSEQVGVERADAAQQQQWERQYAKVADCIRDRGFDDLPEQQPGVLDFNDYPRADEPGFADAASACLAEFAPDTQAVDR
ncbi:hypothetical protein FB462_0687 [Curtobacterium citreum]|nr:hypothetical protein FB462_0687 [Curtobacterium citreum]